jgi:sugar phosphate isomerase/epimerase
MHKSLNGGAIHVSIPTLAEGVRLCHLGGFESIALHNGLISELSKAEIQETLGTIRPGAWGVPFDWRGSDQSFIEGLANLPSQANAMQQAGVTRCATWILPGSNELNFDQNRAFHIKRLTPIANILNDHGMTFGLEFVGPKTSRDSRRHPFIYTLEAMLELGSDIGPNVGLLVDAWHLHSSQGTIEELIKVPSSKIALVHINDAPAGVELDDLKDHDRRLPGETGEINIKGFLNALRQLGYEGPVEAEPFDPRLKELPSDEDRIKKVGGCLTKVFSL